MPQMSPLQWEILFIFSMFFIFMFMSKLFFVGLNPTQNNSDFYFKKSGNNILLNWLW